MFYRNGETHVHNIGGANIYISEDGNPFLFDIRCYVTEVGYVEDVENNGEDIPIVKTKPLRKEGIALWWVNKTGKPELREG